MHRWRERKKDRVEGSRDDTERKGQWRDVHREMEGRKRNRVRWR